MTPHFTDPDALADAIIERVGRRIVLGLPLGLGKANHVANALVARALKDPSVHLHVFTALTLEPPRPKSDLEKRFLGPIIERTLGGYPLLAYAELQRRDALPSNIEVDEFFFQAGTRLNTPSAQRSYISANYTHAAGYLRERGVNVVAQLVAGRGDRFSLSCNTDITLDLLAARKAGDAAFLLVGQVNDELPFMPGDGDLPAEAFSHLLHGPEVQFPLFAPPKEPIPDASYAIGFHAASLVRDGGTIQMGIGAISDAVAQGLIVRHRRADVFVDTVRRLSPDGTAPVACGPFDTGLYAATEMFVDCLLDLWRAGVLKREVDGAVLHGGFFLGPRAFYRALREMPDDERAKFQMQAISGINEIYGDEAARRAARVDARFVNTAMMATLLGAAISDGLDDGRVVSGVGGQYNFVAQAFALEGARSIITLPASRGSGRKAASNILWSYAHGTIPRHLKDVVVTEYGVADLRGRTDRDTIVRMLNLADSRFQPELLDAAKRSGKIEAGYVIPEPFRRNTPERIAEALKPAKDAGLAPLLPFGSDFDAAEQDLLPVLGRLKAAQADPRALLDYVLKGLSAPAPEAALRRLGLESPGTFGERVLAWAVRGAASA
ncbi:acetyl-CoA hydrolase/transferase C-terminal domain-containing protein [Caulobacter endophyticus]|uniref:acetyl-CoA hydrolase/transferase C-terminal domain-containing protein n=1 Tax=Caulobacter endophyticus TaxID=2172652 RepID=UPI00240FDF0C|nr:acetyl-CoA hydrolase/transferase C-terminal domain-containing protein [Caulobacter endophyticus]MDG2529042.1 acetyl-CoA hydrolase/transferase C-terminal domain-containing protein [Caulobacter endophyticus]